jgi:hypothetical protein
MITVQAVVFGTLHVEDLQMVRSRSGLGNILRTFWNSLFGISTAAPPLERILNHNAEDGSAGQNLGDVKPAQQI